MGIVLISGIISLGFIGAACAIARAAEEMGSDQH